jgi:two-component system phosphate regulon sensor histidine kinase PhoR
MTTRITIVSADGTVLADSEEDPTLMENHASRPEIKDALAGSPATSIRRSTTMGKEMLYAAVPVEKNGKVAGVLRVSVFFEEINALLGELRFVILGTGLIVVLASLTGAVLFSSNLSRRIRELADASKRFSEGDFDVRVPRKGLDELADLARSFNDMAATMKTLFERLSGQKQALDGILASIQEGLVVLDPAGKIVLANRGFRDLIGEEDIEGSMYWEVLRSPEFGGFLEELKDGKGSVVRELEIRGKVFLTSAAHLVPSGELVLMLHDITEVKRLERVKKDFIVNVSHELRTPLTAIKGFAETLLEETVDRQREYCEIIVRHTNRLVSIVHDLLLLSEIEEKGKRLQPEEVDLIALLEQVLAVFRPKFEEKGLVTTVLAPAEGLTMEADPFRLEQVLMNLVDNALKYTEKGGITISVTRLPDEISIEVSDTGIGIPEEHLPRIFERFYVVDRSRSRKVGGTGLGLSIVKHIVLLHQGRISVQSQPGRGTSFTIILPAHPVRVS